LQTKDSISILFKLWKTTESRVRVCGIAYQQLRLGVILLSISLTLVVGAAAAQKAQMNTNNGVKVKNCPWLQTKDSISILF
jgi:hypothetical protein